MTGRGGAEVVAHKILSSLNDVYHLGHVAQRSTASVGVTLFDDTIPVLETLRQRAYKIGLVTNSMLPMWMRDVELHAYNIIDYFDARITSGDAGYMKPHPVIYTKILTALEITPEQAVFIGDRPGNDIAGANAVGITSVLMSPPHLNHKLNGNEPDYIITNLSDLLPILEALEK